MRTLDTSQETPKSMFTPSTTLNRAYDLLHHFTGTTPREASTSGVDPYALFSALSHIRPIGPTRTRSEGPPLPLMPSVSTVNPSIQAHSIIVNTNPVNLPERWLRRKHIEQAIKLAKDALEEDARSSLDGEAESSFASACFGIFCH